MQIPGKKPLASGKRLVKQRFPDTPASSWRGRARFPKTRGLLETDPLCPSAWIDQRGKKVVQVFVLSKDVRVAGNGG
jgi:hypothetical protein